jgi:acetyl esterase/lipase
MRGRLLLLVALLLIAGSGAVPSAVAADLSEAASVSTTVTYCNDGGQAQTLDMYEPLGGAARHPLLLVVHGGYWSVGDSALSQQSQFTRAAISGALAAGFAVASINYRLAPANRWPAQIIDTRCAVRYLRATAARWRVDPREFAALGDSAGGQLVSLDALSAQREPQWDSAQYAGQSSALQAVVDCWGIVDLTAPGWSRVGRGLSVNAFRAKLGSPSAALRSASPVSHVGPGAPPFLIIQGLSDTLVPPRQSTELRTLLRAAGDEATLVDVANAGHGLSATALPMAPALSDVARQTVSWLLATLG